MLNVGDMPLQCCKSTSNDGCAEIVSYYGGVASS